MNSDTIEIFKYGSSWIAHRDDDHDCTGGDDDTVHHGVADSEVGALRRLVKAEGAQIRD